MARQLQLDTCTDACCRERVSLLRTSSQGILRLQVHPTRAVFGYKVKRGIMKVTLFTVADHLQGRQAKKGRTSYPKEKAFQSMHLAYTYVLQT
jgi:hypothetical protein